MDDVYVRPTNLLDVVKLSRNLRPGDSAEIAAYGHTDPLLALTRSAAQSVVCWTAFINGELAAVMGCAPVSMMGGVGSPWLIGTPMLDAHPRVLVRETPRYIDEMCKLFPHLVNFVHAENTRSVRWLRRVGFTLHPAEPFGALGEPFHRFEMKD